MNFCKGIFAGIFILFVFLSYRGSSQITDSSSVLILEKTFRNWEFFDIDNPGIKDSAYPASKTIMKSIFFNGDDFDPKKFNNIVWFRKRIITDTSLNNKSVSLSINITGAAELYINQQLIETFGVVANNEKDEVMVSSEIQRAAYPFLPNKEYLIAIRYSNHDIDGSRDDRGENALGLKIRPVETNTFFNDLFAETLSKFTFGIIISLFFFSLAFVHFVIFLFYKEEKANMYYALFCFVAASLAGASVFRMISFYTNFGNILTLIVGLSPAIIFSILPYMIRSFFKLQFPKWYLGFAITPICLIIMMLSSSSYLGIIYFILVTISIIETIRAIFIAVKRKSKGVKIIGIGTSFFLLLVIIILIFIGFHVSGSVTDNMAAFLSLALVLLSIFSIPVSITIFLSYQISLTNKSLSQKLIEVEDLSKHAIEQEKEKQKILEDQKGMLEIQVLERTKEITEQKKIIEEKNKDIIDSINYAKRIQTAILPEINYFKSIFKDSFIIYHPRDIVSGDFYYVTELSNLKILFIADCTGHGVPGALMSMVGSNLIHKIIHENKILNPQEILQTLHIELRQSLKQDQPGSQNRDGMDAAIVIIHEDQLYYAGANRSLLYFDRSNQLLEIKPTKTPIGGSHNIKIEINQHTLNTRDMKEFYLFSDGFADQFGGVGLTETQSAGKKLMISRFKNWLIETLNYSLNEKEIFLNTEFQKWKGNLEQVDDVCVIGIRLNS